MMSMSAAAIEEARRRKVRKGTHSCWECRRRKIRCQFSSPDDVICVGCRARGSACRSQELVDEAPPVPTPERKVSQRLDRLETMMERLMQHILTKTTTNAGRDSSEVGAAPPSRSPPPPPPPPRNRFRPSPPSSLSTSTTDQPQAHSQSNRPQRDDTAALDNHDDLGAATARACPTADAAHNFDSIDVLDSSAADNTPVAALLGIQDTLAASSAQSPPPLDANGIRVMRCPATSSGPGPDSSPESSGGSSSTAATLVDAASMVGGGGGGGKGSGHGSGSVSATTPAPASASEPRHLPSSHTVALPKYRELSRLLHGLFPSQEDINTIVAGGATARYVVSLFHSSHDLAEGRGEDPNDLAVVPAATSHPAVLARRLLQLVLCMQQMSPSVLQQDQLRLADSQALPTTINRITSVVSHTVTANDELIGHVEGLQCLVLMGQQQCNAGQLRKSWLSYRRAMSLAQLVGLDRGDTRALKSCDPTAAPQRWPTAAALWYRINACDRYVSLLLGLRAGTASGEEWVGPVVDSGHSGDTNTDTPQERLGKALTAATGRIIERNHARHASAAEALAATRAIDADLRAAATCNLPPAWWDVPRHDPYSAPEFVFAEISRSLLQVNYHLIMILLHLPYMLRQTGTVGAAGRGECSGSNTAADADHPCYNRTACLRSSREVLQRFINFHSAVNSSFSCRHTDYATLIAAMTLILGYLGLRRPGADVDSNGGTNNDTDAGINAAQNAFDQQLRQDWDMVERVRERMQYIGVVNKNRLSQESAATVQQLMPILDLVGRKPTEPLSAERGGRRSEARAATVTPAADRNQLDTSRMVASPASSSSIYAAPPTPSAVRLSVPYFGTVNIHTSPINGNGIGGTGNGTQANTTATTFVPVASPPAFFAAPFTADAFNGMAMGPGLEGKDEAAALHHWQHDQNHYQQHQQHHHQHQHHHHQDDGHLAALSSPPPLPLPLQSLPADLNAMLIDFDGIDAATAAHHENAHALNAAFSSSASAFSDSPAFPDMMAAPDDWAMQGVDTTYWSLLNGNGLAFGDPMMGSLDSAHGGGMGQTASRAKFM